MSETEHLDVLVVGAGLSGIGAGYYLQARCPGRSFAIVESRGAIGGTWDLFRYPGIRSDSDMYTLGYSFRPWDSDVAIADGASIRDYVRDTASAYGIDEHIRFHHKVTSAAWSSAEARWTVQGTRDGGTPFELTCNFLLLCSGYYDYARGHDPEIAGRAEFGGRIVHPQAWPEGLDYTGQRVVVIGSGATAVTLVPSMATTAAHVTMLQRSPSYVVSRPAKDRIARWFRSKLSPQAAGDATRWKNVVLGRLFYDFCKKYPDAARKLITKGVRAQLGPDFDLSHFSPSYNPWDQRLCLIPDADLFRAIKRGTVEVVTDTIERFTPTGLQLTSGRHLDADLVVTATGLRLQFLGGAALSVDGQPVVASDHKVYKGAMLSDVPNLAMTLGYTNASWTLKCELILQYVCRLLNHMERHGLTTATATPDGDVGNEPLLDFSSGYVQRALPSLPRQGSRVPWKLYQNYIRDIRMLRRGKLDDGALRFTGRAGTPARTAT